MRPVAVVPSEVERQLLLESREAVGSHQAPGEVIDDGRYPPGGALSYGLAATQNSPFK
jgi:hypothetical protein